MSLLSALGAALAWFCEALGPLATKIGQLVSYRTDLFPADLLRPLTRLQDRPSPPSPALVRRLVTDELEPLAKLGQLQIDTAPIGHGTVSLVFRATHLSTGELVAIKVLRPGVLSRLQRDAAILDSLARFAELLPGLRGMPLVVTLRHCTVLLARQADLLREAKALIRLRGSLGKKAGISVPYVYEDLSSDSALVMDFVPISHRITEESSDPRYRSAVRTVLSALYLSIFREGFFHCDLHPGNLVFDVGGNLHLIDCGLVGELADHDRVLFRDFFLSFALKDGRWCARCVLRAASFPPASIDFEALRQDMSALLHRHSANAGEFLIAAFVRDLFAVQRKHRIVAAPAFVTAVLALATYEGLVRARYPELDFKRLAHPFLLGAAIDARAA